MRILFIGDIVGSPGRQIVHDRLADTVAQQQIDLVIANCENAASGFGITPRLAQELLDEGIAVLTGGNHIFDRREILEFFPHEPRLLRPANFPAANPGSGLYLGSVTPRFCSAGLQASMGVERGGGFPPGLGGTPATIPHERGTEDSATTGAVSSANAGAPGASFGAGSPAPVVGSSVAPHSSNPLKTAPSSFGAGSLAPAVGSADASQPAGSATFGAGSIAPAVASGSRSDDSSSSGAGSSAPAVGSRSSLAPSHSPLAPAVRFAVLNLQGRVFMAPNDCPFKTADRELARIPSDVKIILVDFHAEATSEKVAMGWYLDGRVTAVIGTHTHVASADERVLPGGTAVITDVGFTGPHNGVIGMAKDAILGKFLDGLPTRFSVADSDVRMNCALIDTDPSSGRASSISRLCLRID